MGETTIGDKELLSYKKENGVIDCFFNNGDYNIENNIVSFFMDIFNYFELNSMNDVTYINKITIQGEYQRSFFPEFKIIYLYNCKVVLDDKEDTIDM